MGNPLLEVRFRGMTPIMPTVVTEQGHLDESGQRRVIDYCLENGAVALGHFGYASEFYKIGDADRHRLIELIVEHVRGRVPVFIGVTGLSNRIICEYARQAEDLGANLLMVSLPYLNLPNADGAYRLFEKLAGIVEIPIIIQDTGATSPILTADLIARIVNEIGGIHSVKAEGTSFLAKTVEIAERLGGKIQVIGGAGGRHLIHLLRLGVTAFMTGTEALDIHGAVVRAYLDGNEEEAARIYYERLLPYLMFYMDHPEELLKKMLHLRGVIDCPAVIEPRQAPPMSDVEWREFEWVIRRIGDPRQR
jgi:2-keto-3-deoxy-L-arabinonate dehydratase